MYSPIDTINVRNLVPVNLDGVVNIWPKLNKSRKPGFSLQSIS